MLKYGLDIKTPTTFPGDDGWKPVMENVLVRQTFDSVEGLVTFMDRLKAANPQVQLRAVEIQDFNTAQIRILD